MTEAIIAIIKKHSPTHDELSTCRIIISVLEQRSGQLQVIVYRSNINRSFVLCLVHANLPTCFLHQVCCTQMAHMHMHMHMLLATPSTRMTVTAYKSTY